MANKSLHTNQVTFMDLTDDRKLEVYITSTLPITQIKDSNTGEYTPDWSTTALELSADIYLDSVDVTNNQNTTIVWYEQIGAGTKTQVPNSAYIDGKPTSIMINANKMTNDAMVTYSCEAMYQNTTAHDKLTFTRVDTGRNGTDGKDGTSAPAVQAQYSTDGLSGWTSVLNTATHKYIRFSYDSGKTWTVAIKMVGENGTSVSIKGTATARYTVDGTPYYTLSYNSATITDASLGDSYLYGGDLYVCIDDSLAHFMYVGQIQGPKGNDGQSSYVYVMYATDASGTGMTKNPSSTTTHIGVCVSAATSAPNTASSYTWSKFVGDSAKSIILNGTSQIFKVTNSSPVAYLPTSITITAQAVNITIAKWEYSVNGGVNWTTITESNNLSGIVLNSTNNTISITGADMTSNSIVIRASNGAYSDTYTVYKVFDGKGIASITEQYYQSTSATTQSSGSWSNTVPTWANGKYIWTRSVITYTDATTSTTSPICVTGQAGGIGDTGVGISSIDVWYYQSNYATSLSGGSWSTTAPTWSDGKYVWTKTITTYTNGTTDETAAVCITGQKGSSGKGIKSVTEYYLATSSSSGVTTSTTGWTTAIQTIAADKKYLWNYEVITYTDNTTSTTNPIIIGAFGDTGNTGKGIKSVTEYYLATALSSGVTTSTTGWTTTMQSLTVTNKYLWNYELITYTDNTTSVISPVIIGAYGDKGLDAYTAILTNESHVFPGNVSNAIVSSATTQVMAYKGSASQSVTIVSVNGKAASTSSTATGIAGLSFYCSALSGVSPTITFTCTTSFVGPSGAIPIVITVDGMTITKMFAYSIAFKGNVGTPASLVSITPSAHYFKSTTGKGGTFTPEYIYLYPRFQSVTYSTWQYSVDGGISWVAASGANGISIGTYNSVANALRISRTSTLYTDTVTSISFRCVSSTASVYDTVSIAKMYDVVNLEIGGTNLLPQSKMDTLPIKWTQNNSFVIVSEDGYDCAKLTSGIGTSKTPYISIFDKLDTINLAQEYTISAWVKVVNYVAGTTNPYLALYVDGKKASDGSWMGATNIKGNGSLSGYNNQGWKKIEWTIKFAELFSEMKFFVYSRDCTGDLFIRNIKMEKGNKATDWSPAPEDLANITFQIYAPDGYVLSNKLESLTLQTFAYEGSTAIASATYSWSYQENDEWITIADATKNSLTVTKDDVIKTKTYRCIMTYKDATYDSTITVQDISDTYEALICVSDNVNHLTGIYYWIVYALLYSEQGEADALLGPISINAPTSPSLGDYWYAVDGTAQTVTLKKYNGSAWVESTDKQIYEYDWSRIINGSQHQAIGNADKVQIISCDSFTSNATFQCVVTDTDGDKLARCNVHLTDTSDPIVSSTAPTGVKDGQIWIQTQTDGTFLLYIWNTDTSTWKQLNADTKNVVHTKKPSSYKTGDLWVVESDTAITGYIKGTLLQANATSASFDATHWKPSLKYEKEITEMQTILKSYKQYMSVDDDGLHMQAKDADGTLSPFQALFTNTRLSFFQDDLEVAYISDNKLNISEASIDTVSIDKKIQLQKFEWAIESNGSMSLIVNY